jgi:hypothetical protein
MRTSIIIYITAAILLIASVLGIWAARDKRQTPSPDSLCGEGQIPELPELLDKAGNYSFSYVNAHDQRIAAVDDKEGDRYFYIYSPTGELATIVDDNNMPIWKFDIYVTIMLQPCCWISAT